MEAPADNPTARIFDQGYRPFRGELASIHRRFLVIAFNEIRLAWKEKRFRQLLVVSFFPLGVFGFMAVLRGPLMMMAGFDLWSQFWKVQLFFSVAVVYYLGRNAIGEDLRTGALTVYFSRPVSFWQYLCGKGLAVVLGVGAVTLLPGLVLAVFRWLVEPDVSGRQFLRWLVALVVSSAGLCLVESAVVLALSALFGRGRTAGILWVLLFFVLGGLAGGLAHGTGVSELKAVSFGQASTTLAEVLFGSQEWGSEAWWCLLSLAGWTLLATGVVLLKLRRWKGA